MAGSGEADADTLGTGAANTASARPVFSEELVALILSHLNQRWSWRNVSNEPPRGELRDSPNDSHRVSVVSFLDQGAFGVLFKWVPSKTLKKKASLGEWTRIKVGVRNLSVHGGLLDRGPSRCDLKRGQREVAGEFSVPGRLL